jgi:hypothetical protein
MAWIRRAWPILLLALAWGLLPALPALIAGELIGSPWTDLYPSVWGLWWFASQQPGLPTFCEQLAAPEGMPFYYSSPLHGWFATPWIPLIGVPASWNLGVLAARVATVVCAFGAARAWGLERPGALVAAAIYGCAPFFHGYAVEGIVEGLDGWTLALFLWAHARRRTGWAVLAFGLTVISSWYLGAVACAFALLLGRRGWLSMLGGLCLASPFLSGFTGAFGEREALEPAMRRAMGSDLFPSLPGLITDNPFAKTSWVGVIAPGLAIWGRRWRLGLVLGAFWLLSLGLLPSPLRFAYRLHAGVLVVLALLAGQVAQRWRHGGWLALAIVAEGLLLSPVEPLLPSAPAQPERVYAQLPEGPVLDIPGPLAMPPGVLNPSRPRARWFLYQQVFHGQPSPWAPDFNSVGTRAEDGLDRTRALDPVLDQPLPERLDLEVDSVVLHHRELRGRLEEAQELLRAEGFAPTVEADGRSLWLR